MGDPAVRLERVWEAYRRRNRFGWRRGDGHWALRDVTLAVAPSRSLGIVGANGSGKTTLLQVMAGVLHPTRGEVAVRGRVASLVDLSAGFHRDLTGHENLRVAAVLLGIPRRELRRRYDEIVEFSGLSGAALDAPLSSYSAGMGLRLGFALVVSCEPDVLLVDEVLAVGDEAFQRKGVERVHQLQRSGCAVVIVSHDLALVQDHCQQVAVLDRGTVACLDEPAAAVAFYRRHRGPEVAPDRSPPELFESWRVQAARRRRGA